VTRTRGVQEPEYRSQLRQELRFSIGAGAEPGVYIFDWNRSRSDFQSQYFGDVNVLLHFTRLVVGVDNFCVIRSHTRSRSQFLKHRSRIELGKIRLRTHCTLIIICTERSLATSEHRTRSPAITSPIRSQIQMCELMYRCGCS